MAGLFRGREQIPDRELRMRRPPLGRAAPPAIRRGYPQPSWEAHCRALPQNVAPARISTFKQVVALPRGHSEVRTRRHSGLRLRNDGRASRRPDRGRRIAPEYTPALGTKARPGIWGVTGNGPARDPSSPLSGTGGHDQVERNLHSEPARTSAVKAHALTRTGISTLSSHSARPTPGHPAGPGTHFKIPAPGPRQTFGGTNVSCLADIVTTMRSAAHPLTAGPHMIKTVRVTGIREHAHARASRARVR